MSALGLSDRCLPRYFAIALASPKLSVKSRSLSETSIPAPVTPFWMASHSCSSKSALVATALRRQVEVDELSDAPDHAVPRRDDHEAQLATLRCRACLHKHAHELGVHETDRAQVHDDVAVLVADFVEQCVPDLPRVGEVELPNETEEAGVVTPSRVDLAKLWHKPNVNRAQVGRRETFPLFADGRTLRAMRRGWLCLGMVALIAANRGVEHIGGSQAGLPARRLEDGGHGPERAHQADLE